MDQPHPKVLRLLDHDRAVKTAQEIQNIQKGADILTAVFSSLKKFIIPKKTEVEVQVFIEKEMKKMGVRHLAFHPIVASGKNSANIHHWPGKRRIQKGDQVMIDIGAVVNGYCSDMTRMLFIGTPSTAQKNIYSRLLRAQETGVKKVKSGIPGEAIDRAVRSVLRRYRLNAYFTHNLGHGVGRYIHEWPRLGKKSKDVLRPNMVITVEPGIYQKNKGGMRIEDMVRVTKTGSAILTRCEKSYASTLVACP